MTDVMNPALDEGQTRSFTPTVSMLDALAEPVEGDTTGALDLVRVGTVASFVSFFTEDAVPVAAHYLPPTESWTGTYAQCLGQDCPACKAGLARTEYLLLPVADRLEGVVKVLRVTRQKGPGKLLTELGQVLMHPNRADLVVRITRNKNYVHKLEIEAETGADPEITRAIQTFTERVDAGVLDIRSLIPSHPASELITHEKIAKVYAMKGST